MGRAGERAARRPPPPPADAIRWEDNPSYGGGVRHGGVRHGGVQHGGVRHGRGRFLGVPFQFTVQTGGAAEEGGAA